MNRTLRPLALALTFAVPVMFAGCTSDTTAAPAATIEQTTFASALGVNLAAMTRTEAGVYRRDLVVGTGAEVVRAQNLSVRYTGWLANGTEFDSNPSPKPLFVFRLGSGQVIAGWDDGIAGMRVGGRRQLLIPPALGYGRGGNGAIPGNAVLVFNVEVVTAQ
ncbi:MAG: FKBP-type peptidyl-prolyl cis-trans isomerase [Gemmatimonadaceae bacterium]